LYHITFGSLFDCVKAFAQYNYTTTLFL
jgi:hypothetical protein